MMGFFKVVMFYFAIFSFVISVFVSGCVSKPHIKKGDDDLGSIFEHIVEVYPKEDLPEAEEIKLEKDLNIAVIIPVSGIYKKVGSEMVDTVSYTRRKMYGSAINIEIFDTKSQKATLAHIHSEIQKGSYDAIIGPIFNYETAELASYKNTIPIVSLSNDRSLKYDNVLMFGDAKQDSIKDIVTFFSKSGKHNFMAMFPNDANGSGFYNIFKSAVQANKSDIMRVEFYDETGVSSVSKYVNKIVHGISQRIYTSKETGEVVSERRIKDLIKKNPLDLDKLYTIEEKKAEVIYISAYGKSLTEIASLLNHPENKEILKDVVIVIGSGLDSEYFQDLSRFEDMFFYAHNYVGQKLFMEEFKKENRYFPGGLSGLLSDAILYTATVKNDVSTPLTLQKFKLYGNDFYGVNGSFSIVQNFTRREGKMWVIKNGIPREVDLSALKFLDAKKTPQNLEDESL